MFRPSSWPSRVREFGRNTALMIKPEGSNLTMITLIFIPAVIGLMVAALAKTSEPKPEAAVVNTLGENYRYLIDKEEK